MKRTSLYLSLMLISIITLFSSCEAIAGIFKAGMWFGIIAVGVVVFLILWLIGRSRK